MQYFNPEFIEFFKELAANNNKEWFDSNRKRYQEFVKKPFENYVHDLIKELKKRDPELDQSVSDAIFRINKDVRFSEDKSPYKLDRSAMISPRGRKDHSYPGFFLSFGPENTTFGGGSYGLDTATLKQMRIYLQNHYDEFQKLLQNATFKEHYGELKGEEAKRLPKELGNIQDQPLLYKKQFYYMAHLEPEVILSEDLMQITLEYYEAGIPLQKFLRRGLILS